MPPTEEPPSSQWRLGSLLARRASQPRPARSTDRLEGFWPFAAINLVPWTLVVVPLVEQRFGSKFSLREVAGLEFQWQTLIAGGFALQAATIGGFFIYRQIVRDNRADREATRRRLQAELALLSMTLSDLIAYLVVSAGYAHSFLYLAKAPPPVKQPPSPERLQDGLIQQIKDLAEHGEWRRFRDRMDFPATGRRAATKS